MDALERYVLENSTPQGAALAWLERESWLRTSHGRQLCGPVQGALLRHLVLMLQPRRVLEIGTFSGYATIWMAGALPEGGDEGSEIYVMFRNDAVKNVDDKGMFYFNSVYEYEPEENVYYRYAITDLEKPLDNPILFAEQRVTNIVSELATYNELDGKVITSCTRTPGNAITFANVVIQYVENKWPDGEHPYPVLYGTSGNADVFMGGKHYSCVWKRDGVDDRTVFYGEDGNEIELQRGKTLIILMDYNNKGRSVSYE